MTLVSMLDDSSSDKIRKSIFLFASIIFFSWYYKIQITAPSIIFSSTEPSLTDIKITSKEILLILGCFQAYLFIRLCFAWRISYAKFNKFWIVDEFVIKEDVSKLLDELDQFSSYCKENPIDRIFNKTDLETIVTKINGTIEEALEKTQKLDEALTESNKQWQELDRKLSKIQVQNHTGNDPMRFPLPPDNTPLNGTIDLAKGMLQGELSAQTQEIRSVLNGLHVEIDKLHKIKNKSGEFTDKFPKSNYRFALDFEPSDLAKAKNIREWELHIFEFGLPALASLLSIATCILSWRCII